MANRSKTDAPRYLVHRTAVGEDGEEISNDHGGDDLGQIVEDLKTPAGVFHRAHRDDQPHKDLNGTLMSMMKQLTKVFQKYSVRRDGDSFKTDEVFSKQPSQLVMLIDDAA